MSYKPSHTKAIRSYSTEWIDESKSVFYRDDFDKRIDECSINTMIHLIIFYRELIRVAWNLKKKTDIKLSNKIGRDIEKLEYLTSPFELIPQVLSNQSNDMTKVLDAKFTFGKVENGHLFAFQFIKGAQLPVIMNTILVRLDNAITYWKDNETFSNDDIDAIDRKILIPYVNGDRMNDIEIMSELVPFNSYIDLYKTYIKPAIKPQMDWNLENVKQMNERQTLTFYELFQKVTTNVVIPQTSKSFEIDNFIVVNEEIFGNVVETKKFFKNLNITQFKELVELPTEVFEYDNVMIDDAKLGILTMIVLDTFFKFESNAAHNRKFFSKSFVKAKDMIFGLISYVFKEIAQLEDQEFYDQVFLDVTNPMKSKTGEQLRVSRQFGSLVLNGKFVDNKFPIDLNFDPRRKGKLLKRLLYLDESLSFFFERLATIREEFYPNFCSLFENRDDWKDYIREINSNLTKDFKFCHSLAKNGDSNDSTFF